MNNKAKFNVGDKVEVIKYGHLYWSREEEQSKPIAIDEKTGIKIYDMAPELVGQKGIICEVSLTQGKYHYAINGIIDKHAWYDEKQLKKVLSSPKT
jgi:hypothetical protein